MHKKDVTRALTSRAEPAADPLPAPGSETCPQPEKVVTVLAISPLQEDHLVLSNIFSHSKWSIHCVPSWQDAEAYLSDHIMPVIICERDLPDGTWKEVLNDLAGRPDPPLLIVTSRLADDYLWAEVLNLGGYDVLMKPFDQMEVFRVVSLAWLNWKNSRDRMRRADPPRLVAAAGD